jgi:hypothetical protein
LLKGAGGGGGSATVAGLEVMKPPVAVVAEDGGVTRGGMAIDPVAALVDVGADVGAGGKTEVGLSAWGEREGAGGGGIGPVGGLEVMAGVVTGGVTRATGTDGAGVGVGVTGGTGVAGTARGVGIVGGTAGVAAFGMVGTGMGIAGTCGAGATGSTLATVGSGSGGGFAAGSGGGVALATMVGIGGASVGRCTGWVIAVDPSVEEGNSTRRIDPVGRLIWIGGGTCEVGDFPDGGTIPVLGLETAGEGVGAGGVVVVSGG